MKFLNNNILFPVSLMLLAVVAYAGTAGFVYQHGRHGSAGIAAVQQSVNAFSETAVRIPSDWVSYTNKDFSFAIQHPPDWQVSVDRENALRGAATAIVITSADHADAISFFPQGGFDSRVPAQKVSTSSNNLLGFQPALRESYAESINSQPTVCLYQFVPAPAAAWVAPNGSEGIGGNRVHTPCQESATVKAMLFTLHFTDTTNWKTYASEYLGFQFRYPPELGPVRITFAEGDTGTVFRGSFAADGKMLFGGISKEYSAGREGGFLDTQGYQENNGKFLYRFVGSEVTPLAVLQTLETANAKAVFVAGQSSDGPSLYPPAGTLGALVNLRKNSSYSGMAFLDTDTHRWPEDIFEQLIASVVVAQ